MQANCRDILRHVLFISVSLCFRLWIPSQLVLKDGAIGRLWLLAVGSGAENYWIQTMRGLRSYPLQSVRTSWYDYLTQNQGANQPGHLVNSTPSSDFLDIIPHSAINHPFLADWWFWFTVYMQIPQLLRCYSRLLELQLIYPLISPCSALVVADIRLRMCRWQLWSVWQLSTAWSLPFPHYPGREVVELAGRGSVKRAGETWAGSGPIICFKTKWWSKTNDSVVMIRQDQDWQCCLRDFWVGVWNWLICLACCLWKARTQMLRLS